MTTQSESPRETNYVSSQDCFLREPAVLKLIAASTMTLRRWQEADLFPKRYQVGPNIVGWKESEVLHWIASRELAASVARTKEAV